MTYASAYAQARVDERLCGYTFGTTTGNIFFPDLLDPETGTPTPLAQASEAVLFSTPNGIPPTGGVNLINENALEGPRETRASRSPSTGRHEHDLEGALCTRSLATGVDPVTDAPLQGRMRGLAEKKEIRATGDLRSKPAIIVTGRADALIPPTTLTRVFRPEQVDPGRWQRLALHRGGERSPSGYLQCRGRLRQPVRATAPPSPADA